MNKSPPTENFQWKQGRCGHYQMLVLYPASDASC
uniref:Uncharacterized protein n=1 Tax=Rhizophora mucronata TaxID=61149 RepID=A0A2P2IL27_RHIMU